MFRFTISRLTIIHLETMLMSRLISVALNNKKKSYRTNQYWRKNYNPEHDIKSRYRYRGKKWEIRIDISQAGSIVAKCWLWTMYLVMLTIYLLSVAFQWTTRVAMGPKRNISDTEDVAKRRPPIDRINQDACTSNLQYLQLQENALDCANREVEHIIEEADKQRKMQRKSGCNKK